MNFEHRCARFTDEDLEIARRNPVASAMVVFSSMEAGRLAAKTESQVRAAATRAAERRLTTPSP